MELDARYAGTALKPYRTQVDWRQTMNYAAAVSDVNPAYFDDEREGGIMAPPMFGTAVTWAIIGRIAAYIPVETFPRELLLTQVHHTEHLVFHRPLIPGEDVTVRGRIAAIVPHRAGTRVVIGLEARDAHEQPIFTEFLGSILRGVACKGPGQGEGALPRVPQAPLPLENGWEAEIFVEPERPHLYDGCTGIVFPIHTSRRFARQVGLPGIILQGTATLAMAARELVNREASGDPTRLGALACRFSGMVLPGTAIRIRMTAQSAEHRGRHIYFEIRGENGKPAIRDGWAFIRHPGIAGSG